MLKKLFLIDEKYNLLAGIVDNYRNNAIKMVEKRREIKTNNTVQSVHYDWIDWAKILGIYLVTIGHGNLVNTEWQHFIYAFHMPMFFVLSGVLYKQRTFLETIKRSWRTLLIPYLLINFICLLYYDIPQVIRGTFDLYTLGHQLGAIFLGLGYKAGGWIPVSTPLWFVIALFIDFVIMSMLKSLWQMILMCCISVATVLLLHHFNIDIYFPIDSALMAFPFFTLGYLLKDNISKFKPKVWIELVIAVVFLLICYYISTYIGKVGIGNCNFGPNIFIYYLTAIIGSVGFFSFVKLWERIMKYGHIGGGQILFFRHILNNGIQPYSYKICKVSIIFINTIIAGQFLYRNDNRSFNTIGLLAHNCTL